MLRFLTGACLLVLAGCGGMDPQACLAANWHAIGYEDGVEGKSAGRFGRHREACAKHGITADFAAYKFGHGEGVAFFCRPYNGYRLGTRGYSYGGICPTALEPAFLDAHADGFELYTLQTNLQQIGKHLDLTKQRADELEHIIADVSAHLIAPKLAVTERAALAVDLKQFSEERREVEVSIHQLEGDYAAAEQEYTEYRGRNA